MRGNNVSRRAAVFSFSLILTLATGRAAWAGVADTDTTFGTSGIAVTDLGGSSDQNQAVFIGTGDVIYAVGTDSSDGGNTFSHYFITRSSANGALDGSFGSGGKVSIPSSIEPNGFIGDAIAVDETNSFIYLTGNACVGSPSCVNVGVVLRFLFSGALDNNWGSAGVATISTAHQAQAQGLLIKPNCEVLVAGSDQNSAQNSEVDDALVALLHIDGSLDNSFGTSGIKIIDFGTDCDRAQGLTFDASGNLIVTGRAGAMGSGPNFCKTNRKTALTRLSSTGVVDTGFGTNGFTITNFGQTSTDSPNSVVQAGGKIAALVGVNFDTGSGTPSVGVARFNSNGTVDTGFGGGSGLVSQTFTPPTGFDPQGGVDTQGSGKVILGGASNGNAALLRLTGSPELASTKGNSCSIDITPNAFSFTSATNQPLNTVVTSNSVVISGINNPAPISVAANNSSQYSINSGAFTSSPGTVNNNDSVRVRHTTAVTPNTTVTTTLTIGGVQGTFNSTTVGADTTPDPFTFNPQTNVAINTPIQSNTVAITGINTAAAISIAGGTAPGYSIGCTGTFTSANGTINNNDTVCVRQTSSASPNTLTTTTLTIGGLAGTFQVTTSAADTTPDQFTFNDQNGVPTGTPTLSNVITVSGIDTPAPISISGNGGQFSINGGGFTSTTTVVSSGQTVQLRLTSSGSANTLVSTTLNIGGVTGSFNVTTGAVDTTPNQFTFSDQTDVPQNTLITSAPITVSGINAATPISVAGGGYSIGCTATFTTASGTVNNSDTVCVQHTSGSGTNSSVNTTLTIGGVSDTFTSTTTPDTTPDQFTFVNQSAVPVNTVRTSNTVTITGIDGPAPISVTGGTYSVGCASNGFTSQAGTISNSQTVCVRHTSSPNFLTATDTTLTVGGVSGTFTSTTEAQDTTPDAFSFTPQNNVAKNATITSNAITVSGINSPATISVVGGLYNINGGAFTSSAGTISNGDLVRVQHTSAAADNTATDTTLTIGGVNGVFTSTTGDSVPDAFGFIAQNNVARSSVITSNAVTIAGLTIAAPVTVTGGLYNINGGAFTSSAGTISNGDLVRVQHTSAATFSTATNTTLTIGGINGTFTSTTLAQDTTPDQFTFSDQTGVARSALITSAPVTISGINSPAPVSVTGGQYNINGGAFTAADGAVSSGDIVRVQHTSSADFSTATNTTLTVGGVSDTFTSTTEAQDTTPAAFTFNPVNGAPLSTLTVSNNIGVSGINSPAAISISGSGGQYSINNGAFTSADGTVNNNDTVKVQLASSASYSTTTSTTLTIGGVSGGFSVTTGGAPDAGGALGWTTLLLGLPGLLRLRRRKR